MTGRLETPSKLFFSPRFWVISAALWTTAVIALATSPDLQSSWLMKTVGDKVIHSLAFTVGAVVWIRAIQAAGRAKLGSAMLWGSAAVVLVGVAVELLQYYVPSRRSDVRDFAADVLGVLVALLGLAVGRWLRGQKPVVKA